MSWTNGQYIWDMLLADIGNEYGVAGLMGNLLAESNLIPYRVQGDFSNGYTDSIEYTKQVDNGTISEYDFVHNGLNGGGYGLAQWTFYTRKQGLYDMKKQKGVSIGSIELAVEFIIYELHNTHISVYNVLKNSSTIKEASDYALHNYLQPADQSEAVENLRESLGQNVYNTYAGGTQPNPNPNPTPTPSKRRCMPIWMYSQFRQ